MADIWKIAVFILLLAAALFLSGARFISFGGVAPDLPLLLFLLLFFRTEVGRSLKPLTFLFLIAAYLLFALVIFRFWFAPALLLGVIIAILFFFGRRLTGEAFIDFIIALAVGTVVFYGLGAAFFHRPLLPFTAGMEFLITAVLGAILWFPVSWLGKILPRR